MNHQLSILDQIRADEIALLERLERERYPFVAGSATSYAAAARIARDAPKLRERVFAYIEAHGPVTDEQIANGTALNPSTARPRRLELYRAGRITLAGYSHTAAGRKAKAWAVTTP